MKTKTPKQWTDNEIETLCKLNAQGLRVSEISVLMKRPRSSIHKKIKDTDLEYSHYKCKELNLSSTEAAYIAGFVDGEGCITFNVQWNKDKTKVKGINPQIQISNSHEPTISWIADKINSNGKWTAINYYKSTENRFAFGSRKHYRLTVSGYERIKPVLEAIKPYLRIKQKQAEKVLEFIESRKYRSPDYRLEELKLVLETKKLTDSRKAPHVRSRKRLENYINGILELNL